MEHHQRSSPTRWSAGLLLAGLLSLACAAAGERPPQVPSPDPLPVREPLAWDQANVTALAWQLHEAVVDLREQVRRQPPLGIASGQDRGRHQLLDLLRLLRTESRHLARELEAGQGHDPTYPVYQRIQEMRRAAALRARRQFITEPVMQRIEQAREILIELGRYYRPEEPPGTEETS